MMDRRDPETASRPGRRQAVAHAARPGLV